MNQAELSVFAEPDRVQPLPGHAEGTAGDQNSPNGTG